MSIASRVRGHVAIICYQAADWEPQEVIPCWGLKSWSQLLAGQILFNGRSFGEWPRSSWQNSAYPPCRPPWLLCLWVLAQALEWGIWSWLMSQMGTFVYLLFSVHLWHVLSEGNRCETRRSTYFVPSPTGPSKEILLRCPCLCSYSCLLSCSVMSDSLWPWGSLPGSSVHGIFFRQEYWSGLPFPPPGNLPDPVFEPTSCVSCIAGGFIRKYCSYYNITTLLSRAF